MNHTEIEAKWSKIWEEAGTYRTVIDHSKPKFYTLSMFPYPSGSGLHVGHPLGYIAADVYARYKRMQGYNVLHPIGFDAFGLPAEQYAIQTGQHPAITTANNIETYNKQLKLIGLGYDWSREIQTCDPAYYKWTQWIFLKMYGSWYNPDTDKAEHISTLISKVGSDETILSQHRLAYLADMEVNWCPVLGTVLSNEEVIDGLSERGNHPVEKRMMRQWCLRMLSYRERLLSGLDGLEWSDPVKSMTRNWLNDSGLRDSVFARQRYWGEPIPVCYVAGKPQPLPEETLPLELPPITNFAPSASGQSPLANLQDWTFQGHPLETNTMPGWAGSSWYYLRYMDPNNSERFVGEEAVNYWQQVDLYIGGTEHTTGHLLYIRFWTKFLHDMGYLPFDEPVKRLVNQGMILGESGEKMSKRSGNVVNPDNIIAEYGADTFRVYEMFLGPLEQNKPWNTDNISGSSRFLNKYIALHDKLTHSHSPGDMEVIETTIDSYLRDIEKMSLNTCISGLMKCVNHFQKSATCSHAHYDIITKLLSPFAPFITEEMWNKTTNRGSIIDQPFPIVAPKVVENFNYKIMVNGKQLKTIDFSVSIQIDEIEKLVKSKLSEYVATPESVTRVIVVHKKLINIITK